MAREPKTAQAETTQGEPTRPRPVDAAGRMLDRWGLPLLGPDRIEALDGRADPEIDPTDWEEVVPPAAAAAPTSAPETAAPSTPQES